MPFHWLLAAMAALAMGAAASAWLWLHRRRRDEADAGMAALGAMRWREFSRFVLDAMRHRGYDVDAEARALAGAQPTDFILKRGDRRWLLACRHGAESRVDTHLVHGLETALLANRASGGVIVTTGHVDPDARKAVGARPKLELASGRRLWRELQPLLPETLRDEAAATASRQARGRIRLAWLGAVAVGVVVLLVAGRAYPPTVPATPRAAVAADAADPATGMPAPAADAGVAEPPPATEAPAPAASVPEPVPASPGTAMDPAGLALERSRVATAVSALPGVDKAAWVSESTLLVHLRSAADAQLPDICAILEQSATLQTSRLQLQPPPGSAERVRFRQCRVF